MPAKSVTRYTVKQITWKNTNGSTLVKRSTLAIYVTKNVLKCLGWLYTKESTQGKNHINVKNVKRLIQILATEINIRGSTLHREIGFGCYIIMFWLLNCTVKKLLWRTFNSCHILNFISYLYHFNKIILERKTIGERTVCPRTSKHLAALIWSWILKVKGYYQSTQKDKKLGVTNIH